MDAHKISLEIGLFETALNLEKSAIKGVSISMPLPLPGVQGRINNVAEWLLSLRKKKYMFLTPELALLDAMAGSDCEAVFVMPCDMSSDSKERLINNIPRKIKVSIIQEPYFPDGFIPKDSLIVTCGYTAGRHLMIMNETYRLIGHYGGFHGKKVFVPFVNLENFECFNGWHQAEPIFNESWSDATS